MQKEIRIGNLVSFLGETKEVIGVSNRLRPDCGYYHFDSLEPQKGIHISPIQITKKWLIKLGFTENFLDVFDYKEEDVLKSLVIVFNCGENICEIQLLRTFDNEKDYDTIYFKLNHIKYVHQLQNLYFSLTGEDLIPNKK